jgi:hypothetical protein
MSKPVLSVMSTPSASPLTSVPLLGGFCSRSWFDAESTLSPGTNPALTGVATAVPGSSV